MTRHWLNPFLLSPDTIEGGEGAADFPDDKGGAVATADDEAGDAAGGAGEEDTYTYDEDGDGDPPSKQEKAADGDDARGDDESDIDDELRSRAEEAGLTADDVDAFGSAEALERALDILDQRIATVGRGDSTGGEKAGDTASEAKPFKPEPFKLDLKESEFDPEVVKALKGINDHYAQQLNAVYELLDGVRGQVQAQVDEARAVEFDRWIKELGKEYHDLVGQGRTAELKPNSKEAKARKAIRDEMEALKAGYEKTGRKVPSRRELFNRAVRLAFADKAQTIARRQVAERLRGRSGRFVSRPTNGRTRTESVDPQRRATEFVRGFMADRGISADDDFDIDGV